MSWVSATMAAFSVGKGIYGAENANQVKQRNKGYIEDAYRGAVQRQGVHEQDVRQGTAEDLNARGMLSGGQQFASGSGSMTQAAYGAAPSTLGGQQQADTNRELGLERHDLDAAHTRASNENNADYLNNLVGAATNTASGIMQAYGAKQTMDATNTMGTNGASRTIAPTSSGMVDSVPPGSQFHPATGDVMGAFGYHPNTAAPQTVNGFGQNNSDFHVG